MRRKLFALVCLSVLFVGCERSAEAGVFRNRVTAAVGRAGVAAARCVFGCDRRARRRARQGGADEAGFCVGPMCSASGIATSVPAYEPLPPR